MANYASLKAAVQDVIKQNGNNEITGQILQSSLLSMITSLGAGYQYVGLATPTTNPGTPDYNIYYFAYQRGAYSNFNNLSVLDNEFAIFKYNGSWSKESIPITSLDAVNEIRDELNAQISDNYFENGESGKYINNNGQIITTTLQSAVSPIIPVNPGDVILFSSPYVGATGLYLIHCYENYNDTTSVEKYLASNSAYTNYEFIVPAGINYVRVWGRNTGASVVVKSSIRHLLDDLLSDFSNFLLASNALSLNYFEFSGKTDDDYILTNGKLANSPGLGSVCTKYLPVTPGAKYRYSGGWMTNAGVCYVCGYPEDSELNPQILVPADAATKDVEITIPAGINYIRAWSLVSNNPIFAYAGSGSIQVSINQLENNSFEKTIVGTNLFDKNKVTLDSYIQYSTGNVLPLSGYSASDFIPVSPNTHYVQRYDQQLAFYDADKNYISGIASSSGGYTTPNNCYYIRICNSTSQNDLQQVNEGNTLLGYSPAVYGYKDLYIGQGNVISDSPVKTIVATRNAANYNSIREIMESITDASPANPYEIIIPAGRWFESDIKGKNYVTLVGADRELSIIYCDGTAQNLTPADYPYPDYANTALADIPNIYKHCIFARENIKVRNLTIEDTAGKYCAHLDATTYQSAIFENCHFIAKENVSYPIGIGNHGGQNLVFKNCIIERTVNGLLGVFAHNWNNQSAPCGLSFVDCYFKNCGFINLDELGSEQEDNWNLINCYSDCGGAISFTVDQNSAGKTYWINPATGTNEPDPTRVPYCIKFNCLGSNVGPIIKSLFYNTQTVARPNAEKYIISDTMFSVGGLYDIGKVYHGYMTGYNRIINNTPDMPIFGCVQNQIDGSSYFVGRGGCVCVANANISGSIGGGLLVYEKSDHYLTTNSADAIPGTGAIGIMVGGYYSNWSHGVVIKLF